MSVCFGNLMIAAKKLAMISDSPAKSGQELFNQIANLNAWDQARQNYYSWDPESVRIFDWVQQLRAAASFYNYPYPFQLDNEPYSDEVWQKLSEQAQAMTSGFAEGDYILDRIDTWLLESYTLPGRCEVEPGDAVMDCGTYTGNTSLYFAKKTGPAGHVYGFEAASDTFRRYARNMAGHNNVTPINAAVCDASGAVVFSGNTAGARISKGDGFPVTAVSLDDFVQEHDLDRVGFIKMDIEGAEESALLGAKDVIRRFRPKMALSAYHRGDDLLALPRVILELNPDYHFALRHFSRSVYETVLYCIPGPLPADRSVQHDERDLLPPTPQEMAELFFILRPFFMRSLDELCNARKELEKERSGQQEQVHRQIAVSLEIIRRLTNENQQLATTNQHLTLESATLRRLLQKYAGQNSAWTGS